MQVACDFRVSSGQLLRLSLSSVLLVFPDLYYCPKPRFALTLSASQPRFLAKTEVRDYPPLNLIFKRIFVILRLGYVVFLLGNSYLDSLTVYRGAVKSNLKSITCDNQ